MNNIDPIEQEIQAKGLTAPRVTSADIEAEIASEHYFTAWDGRLGALAHDAYVGRERPQKADADLLPSLSPARAPARARRTSAPRLAARSRAITR